MRTASLETVRASVSTTNCHSTWSLNEQVSSDDHQMSLAGGVGPGGPRSDVQGGPTRCDIQLGRGAVLSGPVHHCLKAFLYC